MKRDEILQRVTDHQPEPDACGVKSLALFGSVARDEARPGRDVDVPVEFGKPVGLFGFVRLKNSLENPLGHRADLVTPDALRRAFRDRILKEAVHAVWGAVGVEP